MALAIPIIMRNIASTIKPQKIAAEIKNLHINKRILKRYFLIKTSLL